MCRAPGHPPAPRTMSAAAAPKPAPGSPFHYAFPVHDLAAAKAFYGGVLGCKEGRSSEKWQDYSLYGHQIVAHWAGEDYRCQDYYNPVDGDEVPVPHFGAALTEPDFHDLAARLKAKGVKFIIEPHLRFEGKPGEQWTMFFKVRRPSLVGCALRQSHAHAVSPSTGPEQQQPRVQGHDQAGESLHQVRRDVRQGGTGTGSGV